METLQELLDGSTTPLWSALLLGLMTAVSPCPLATNIATVGYLGHDATNRHRVFLAGLCYTLGRVLTYTVLGMVLIPLLRRGADLFDERDHMLDLFMAQRDGIEHDVVGDLVGPRLDHDDLFRGAGDGEVQIGSRPLFAVRV